MTQETEHASALPATYIMGLPAGQWNAADVLLARELLGMTQAKLAEAVGYTRQGIVKIEGGGSPVTKVFSLAIRALLYDRFAPWTGSDSPVPIYRVGMRN